MPDRPTLAETEKAMSNHVSDLPVDFPAAAAVSSLYRAANAVRLHLTNSVLRKHGLTWTGFVVLWVVWIWDGAETRRAAENAAISKATLTGVVKTLEARGLMARRVSETDRRLVNLELTPAGLALMKELYPVFNAAEAEVVAGLSPRSLAQLTNSLRSIVTELETKPTAVATDPAPVRGARRADVRGAHRRTGGDSGTKSARCRVGQRRGFPARGPPTSG
ncbi:MAG TPA: MarR family transcriptional regulator, partial [Propionibacteriaceae bacterium]|nr:MarR family transcriptional regulator [Propionibacteriaceae bacterium]